MSALVSAASKPTIGEEFEGGYYAGAIWHATDQVAAIFAAPMCIELPAGAWAESRKRIATARSFSDGEANTRAMAEAGSALAAKVLAFDDGRWYIPARDELELLYRAFKPTVENNWVFRNGDNPSSIPAGYPYEPGAPAQTSLAAFRQGGDEAFSPLGYWSSTQYAGNDAYAWAQYFDGGYQGYFRKADKFLVRPVRRLII